MTSLGQRFRLVLSKLSDELESADVESLKYICKTGEKKVPAQSLEKATTAEAVFDLMIDHGLLSERNTVQLKNWLQCKKYQPCLELIAHFEIENQEELSRSDSENEGRRIGPCNIQEEMIVRHFQETSMLDKLKQAMEDEDFVALAGILGCGKSQIAMYYALQIFRGSHPDGICWKIGCKDEVTLMNSLKNFVNELKLSEDKSKQGEFVSNENSIHTLCNLIKKEIHDKFFKSSCNLIILDDVMPQTKQVCEIFKDILTHVQGLKVKVIVTTMDATFCNQDEIIPVTGFSEEEAVKFLQQGKEIKQQDKEGYTELVNMLGCHPLLLHGAMTRMNDTRVKPKRFIKDLKGIRNMDKLTNSPDDITGRKHKMFTILGQYLCILKENEDQDVFDMILALQYLAIEDIPVLLFDFFPTTKENMRRVNTSDFLAAIQKFSFGILRGEDDDRFITTHLAIAKAIELEMEDKHIEDKVRLMKKVLTSFMLLMDKDNYHTKDYDRNKYLLPHALTVLNHVKKMKKANPDIKNNFELNVLLTYVYDIVGYTYNFFGILKNAGEHSTAARQTCFEILKISEEEIDKEAMRKISQDHDSNTSRDDMLEKFNDIKAGIIFDRLKIVVENEKNKEMLCEIAGNLVLNKYRGHGHIELLESYIGSNLEEEYYLTEDEYDILKEKHLAMPKDLLGPAFLYELVLQVFYSYGRRVFYLGDAFDKELAKNFTNSLYLAYFLAQRIANEFPGWNIMYVMLSELNGILELPFEDKADMGLKTIENLEKAAEKFKGWLSNSTTHFIFGIVKSDSENSDHHKHICYKRLVKCYSTMGNLTKDESKLKTIKEEGAFYQAELNKRKTTTRQVMSASISSADFDSIVGKYDEAETQYMVVAPEDMIDPESEMKTTTLAHKELQALKGLTEVYQKKGEIEKANILASRIRRRLGITNMTDELAEFVKFQNSLGLSQAPVDER